MTRRVSPGSGRSPGAHLRPGALPDHGRNPVSLVLQRSGSRARLDLIAEQVTPARAFPELDSR